MRIVSMLLRHDSGRSINIANSFGVLFKEDDQPRRDCSSSEWRLADIAVGLNAPNHTPSGDVNVYLRLLLRRFSTSFSPVVVFFRPRLDLTSYFLNDDTASAVYPPTLRQCGSNQR